MAISEDLPGVKVEITVKGRALKEHRDSDLEEDDRTTTRYIEAVSGEEFAVSIKLLKHFKFKGDCVTFVIYADGECVDAPLIEKNKGRKRVSEGVQPGDGTIRKYRFESLETVNDGRAATSEVSKVKYLGMIEVDCIHGTFKYSGGPRHNEADDRNFAGAGIVSEKALKGSAVSHNIELSNPVPSEGITVIDTVPVEGEPDPAATFVFKYRSLDALKSMLIIPRTPTPPPLEERDPTTLSTDELRELQRIAKEHKASQASTVKVKREPVDANPRPRKRARPFAGDTGLQLDNGGSFRSASTETLVEREVIELD